MKKMKRMRILVCIVLIFALGIPSMMPSAASDDIGKYVYTFNITVNNPCNSRDMDRDAVCTLFFDFQYTDRNGYGNTNWYRFDMSWASGSNRNSSFLWDHFIRPNDNSFRTSFDLPIYGKLNQMYIKLNMDGGERLTFTVDSIECNGKRINTNTDYVSSAYYDSEARIYCSMESSVIDENHSPYFKDSESNGLTQSELNNITNGVGNSSEYTGKFRDQYNTPIDLSVLKRCVSSYDGDINQFFSHSDETSYYKYTFWVNVDNPINLNDADYDEVEEFWLDMHYIDANGYGKEGTYRLDMSYNSGKNRYNNPGYLAKFQRYDDKESQIRFDVWVPGILTKVTGRLNMSGEKLSAEVEKITLNSTMINTTRDYLSSVYFDSDLEINCFVPPAAVVTDSESLASEAYSTDFRDQFGAIVSKKLFTQAQNDPNQYIYRGRK